MIVKLEAWKQVERPRPITSPSLIVNTFEKNVLVPSRISPSL